MFFSTTQRGIQDVLHDLQAVCALIISGNADAIAAQAQASAVAASSCSLQCAAHALSRLLDLLQVSSVGAMSFQTEFCYIFANACVTVAFCFQSLWKLTNPDVCETLDGIAMQSLPCVDHVNSFPLWNGVAVDAAGLTCCPSDLDGHIASVIALFESENLHMFTAMYDT
jgi:hypothetical protein